MTEKKRKPEAEPHYCHDDPVVDQALEWFLRRQAEGSSGKEFERALDAWLSAEPAHRIAWEDVCATWDAPETLFSARLLAIDLDGEAISPIKHSPFVRKWSTIALALAASLAAIAVFPHFGRQFVPRLSADYTTQTGERREVLLPDGSRMSLNTYSAVALDFEGHNRGVRVLEGEVFFDVVHNPAYPFLVSASHSEVEVKGTEFAVSIEDGWDKIRLKRGAVDARRAANDNDLVHLKPGEMVTVDRDAISGVSSFSPDQDLAWLDGRIVIDNQTAKEALREIGRYFNGRIIVINSNSLDAPVSGFYRTDQAAEAIANIVAAAGGNITYLPGDFVIIR